MRCDLPPAHFQISQSFAKTSILKKIGISYLKLSGEKKLCLKEVNQGQLKKRDEIHWLLSSVHMYMQIWFCCLDNEPVLGSSLSKGCILLP